MTCLIILSSSRIVCDIFDSFLHATEKINSAHSLFSNASLAPEQTLSAGLEKKLDVALLSNKSIVVDDDSSEMMVSLVAVDGATAG